MLRRVKKTVETDSLQPKLTYKHNTPASHYDVNSINKNVKEHLIEQ